MQLKELMWETADKRFKLAGEQHCDYKLLLEYQTEYTNKQICEGSSEFHSFLLYPSCPNFTPAKKSI